MGDLLVALPALVHGLQFVRVVGRPWDPEGRRNSPADAVDAERAPLVFTSPMAVFSVQ